MSEIRRKLLYIILGLIILFSPSAFSSAIQAPEVRELESDFLDIDNDLINSGNDIIYSSKDVAPAPKRPLNNDNVINAPVLQGGISELIAIVDKSQIIRFDEPVKRISITNPSLVDMVFLSPKEIIVNGKQAGETTVIIWGEEGGEPVFFNLFVENSNLAVMKEIKKVAPTEDIKVDFSDSSDNRLILTGTVSSSIIKDKIMKVAEAYGFDERKVVDLTETMEAQVMLEVKIVEMAKTTNKSLQREFKQGIMEYVGFTEEISSSDWYYQIGDERFGTGNGEDEPGVHELIFNQPDFIENWSQGASFTQDGGYNYWKAWPDRALAAKINAAESEGIVKVISEPKVMVVNGEEAMFDSSTKIQVPSGQSELGATLYAEASVGTTITITPKILEETKRIQLDVDVMISEIAQSVDIDIGTPINERNTVTKIEIANNQTTVITGLTRKSESKTITKFPFLSNIPIIGKFFGGTTNSNDDSELMIFITASIIKPDIVRGK